MPTSGTVSSRLIALLLLALVLLTGHRVMIQPIVDLYHGNAATIAAKTERLQRYRRLAGERETLAGQLADLQRDRRATAGYIAKSSDVLSATAVQDRAAATVGAVGGEVKSVELLPGSTVEDYPVGAARGSAHPFFRPRSKGWHGWSTRSRIRSPICSSKPCWRTPREGN